MLLAPTQRSVHGDALPALVAVPVDTLHPWQRRDFELYLWANRRSPAVLFRDRNTPLSADDIHQLREAEVQSLHVPAEEYAAYRRYLKDASAPREPGAPARAYQDLKSLNRTVFESAAASNLSKLARFATARAADLTQIVCDREAVLSDVFSVMDHDYYTYTHGINVSVYSLMLADALGRFGRQELIAMAAGALLHDVGKRHIPLEILNKPGKLNEEEWEIMRRHPKVGFEEFLSRGDLSWDQLMTIYQHHERLDGSGYPLGLTGEEIHPWARICAIADVFDALTSQRPYRTPWPARKAFAFLKDNAGTSFDEEMVRCWCENADRMEPAS